MGKNDVIRGLRMRYLYKRELYIPILFFLLILLVSQTLILPYNDSRKFASEDIATAFKLIENEHNDTLIVLPKTQYKFSYNTSSYITSIFGIFSMWESILALQFAFQVISIDKRKQIIALIIRHFEGGKYKESLSFL